MVCANNSLLRASNSLSEGGMREIPVLSSNKEVLLPKGSNLNNPCAARPTWFGEGNSLAIFIVLASPLFYAIGFLTI